MSPATTNTWDCSIAIYFTFTMKYEKGIPLILTKKKKYSFNKQHLNVV